MSIRRYRPTDSQALADVYRNAIFGLGAGAYSPHQLATWAAYARDLHAFAAKLRHGLTLISMQGPEIAGFAQLHPFDHVALLFTNSPFARRGHASKLCDALEAHAVGLGVEIMRTAASHVARPFFLQRGYRVVELETVEVRGVPFERFKMRRRLDRRSGSPEPLRD